MENRKTHQQDPSSEQDNFIGDSQFAPRQLTASSNSPGDQGEGGAGGPRSMSPPVFSLKASIGANSPAPAPTAQPRITSGPMQLTRETVDILLKKRLKEKPKNKGYLRLQNDGIIKKTVNQFLSKLNTHNDDFEKYEIGAAWNEGLKSNKQKVNIKRFNFAPKPPEPDNENNNNNNNNEKESKLEPSNPQMGLMRRHSMDLQKERFGSFLQKVSSGVFINVYNPSKEKWDKLMVMESATDSARLVRLAWIEHQKYNNFPKGALFALKRGSLYGIFEATPKKDIIYTPLRENINNTLIRDGQTATWTQMALKMNQIRKNQTPIKNELLATLLYRHPTKYRAIMDAMGAMICDAKWSLTGYISYVQDLVDSNEVNPLKLFNSNTPNPVWGPSKKEGRQLPLEKSKKIMMDEKKNKNEFDWKGPWQNDLEPSVSPEPPEILKNKNYNNNNTSNSNNNNSFNINSNNSNNNNTSKVLNFNSFNNNNNNINSNNINSNNNTNNSNSNEDMEMDNNENIENSFVPETNSSVAPNSILPNLNNDDSDLIEFETNEEYYNNENNNNSNTNNNENNNNNTNSNDGNDSDITITDIE